MCWFTSCKTRTALDREDAAVLYATGPVHVLGDYEASVCVSRCRTATRTRPGHVTAATDLDEHGRGLQLVAMLADSWGSTRTIAGKAVWIELAAAGPPPLP